MPQGAAVVYRDYDDPRRAAKAARYRSICAGRDILFLVGADIKLACRIAADGAHMPSQMLHDAKLALSLARDSPPKAAGTQTGKEFAPSFRLVSNADKDGKPFVITAACHNAEELALAEALGADLAFLSPVFATQSHPSTDHLGAMRFRALAAASPLPVIALGGVDEKNARLVAGPNVAGLAAIGAFAGQG